MGANLRLRAYTVEDFDDELLLITVEYESPGDDLVVDFYSADTSSQDFTRISVGEITDSLRFSGVYSQAKNVVWRVIHHWVIKSVRQLVRLFATGPRRAIPLTARI